MPRQPDDDEADDRAALLDRQKAGREAREAVLSSARTLLVEIAGGTKVLGALSQAENKYLAAALVVLIDAELNAPARAIGLLP
jgi:hypothetical protein